VKTKRSISYEQHLNKWLKDPDAAAEYLNAHLEEEDSFDALLFLTALNDIAKAHGVAEVAKKAGVGRESLYKSLSKKSNPKIFTLVKILKVLGLKFVVKTDKKKKVS
jgi:probable addiction module antidote protein